MNTEKEQSVIKKAYMKGSYAIVVLLYLGLAGISVWLNSGVVQNKAANGADSIPINTLVNLVFFTIIGLILLYLVIKSYKPLEEATVAFHKVVQEINEKYNQKQIKQIQAYKYRNNIFENALLDQTYRRYVDDNGIISRNGKEDFRCNIEDYINEDLLYDMSKKHYLNQIPGIMTGLGILGTFLGLSIGLNDFSIDTVDGIQQSISPLMAGIKVAFHTSVYGLVFSLVISTVNKNVYNRSRKALYEFIDLFNKYVAPRTKSEYTNVLMQYQEKQANYQDELLDKFTESVTETLKNSGKETNELIEPKLDEFSSIIEEFGKLATERQTKALDKVVTKFLKELGQMFGKGFEQVGEHLAETTVIQKECMEAMKVSLASVNDLAKNLVQINKDSMNIVEEQKAFQQFTSQKVAEMSVENSNTQNLMKQNASALQTMQALQQRQAEQFSMMQNQIAQCYSKMEEALSSIANVNVSSNERVLNLAKTYETSIETVSKNVSGQMQQSSAQLVKVIQMFNGELDKSLKNTFEMFDDNLSGITKQLSDTVLEVRNTVEEVNEKMSMANLKEPVENQVPRNSKAYVNKDKEEVTA